MRYQRSRVAAIASPWVGKHPLQRRPPGEPIAIVPVPPSGCWTRVLRTQFGNQQSTTFLVTVDEKNYVVACTAILRGSEEHRPDLPKSTAKAQKHQARADRKAGNTAKREKTRRGQERPGKPPATDERGEFCSRCRGELAADPRKPYCPEYYKSWARYKKQGLSGETLPLVRQEPRRDASASGVSLVLQDTQSLLYVPL